MVKFDWSAFKKNKYNNSKTELDGHVFDSRKEAKHYVYLRSLQSAGKITNLELQPRYELQPGYRGRDGVWVRPIAYVADFRYRDAVDGSVVVVDVKSKITESNPVYRLKRKLFLFKYPDVVFREIV